MDTITQWVKDNIWFDGFSVDRLYEATVKTYALHLCNRNSGYYNDLRQEYLDSDHKLDLFDKVALSENDSVNIRKEQPILLWPFREDLIKRIHDIEEQEEAEEIDNGIDNSERLMQEHR